MPSRTAIATLVGIGIIACSDGLPSVTQIAPGALKVDTGKGVSLEVLDWGGTGPALVFLAGGGASTAHGFDDFAPRFTDRFRVLGITRRGNVGSSNLRPKQFSDLVDDIVAVLDALQLRAAVLVGHSFAGLEMALFGEKHADRCLGLIYLDAAYDYTDPALGEMFEKHQPPSAPPMLTADSTSIEAVRAWYARTQGFQPTVSSLRSTRRFDANGRLVGAITPGSAKWTVTSPAPRWESIACRSVGIYAMPAPPATWLLYWDALDSTKRASANRYYSAFAPWAAANRAAFGKHSQNQIVEFPSSNHYFFLEQPKLAERTMREFLAQLQ